MPEAWSIKTTGALTIPTLSCPQSSSMPSLGLGLSTGHLQQQQKTPRGILQGIPSSLQRIPSICRHRHRGSLKKQVTIKLVFNFLTVKQVTIPNSKRHLACVEHALPAMIDKLSIWYSVQQVIITTVLANQGCVHCRIQQYDKNRNDTSTAESPLTWRKPGLAY